MESPTKARTLGRFLGPEFVVEATYGHVRDLPEKKMGVVVKATGRRTEFIPEYVVTKKQQDRMDEIEKSVAKAGTVYLATDPDREGEAIAFHVAELLKDKYSKFKDQGSIKRIVFHEITKTAIDHALESPRKIDMPLVNAQQARRILDRLVGYKLSPLLWRKVRRGLSAGRVQSVAVRLVVEKEREIEAFVPVEYWDVFCEVSKIQGPRFRVQLGEKNGGKIKIGNGEEAAMVKAELERAVYAVENVEKKEAKRTPPAPFTTSTLQQAGASRFGWSAKKTMQVAQSLYEKGWITYHRTDSTNMASEAVEAAGRFIAGKWGARFALEKPRLFATKNKVAQEAHEAIRPTEVERDHLAGEGINRDEIKLYDLVWRRFVASQMAEAELLRVGVSVSGDAGENKYGLTARGQTITFEGWLKLYPSENAKVKVTNYNDQNEECGGEKEENLPEVSTGEKLELAEVLAEQKFTQPPARFSDATLVKTLEEKGIGRPSTYAPILTTIQDRQYVEKVDKRFRPTPLGVAVNDFLVEHFPGVVDYQFTAKMEDDLDAIANGEKDWEPVLGEFYGPFEKIVETVAVGAARVKVEVEKTGDKCPLCGEGEVVVRIGRFGRFLACSRYPECKYKANFVNKIGVPCPKCGGDIIVRRTRNRKTFYGCSNYPKCDFASWTKPVAADVKI